METIVRSRGANRSEEILSSLCDRAFLPLWCYPNLFRAKGKELADVLIVFGDDVVIFSDKDCSFPNTGNLETDWSRWKRRSIDESIRQLVRAQRWLREHPAELYLDAACRKPFPLPINPHGRFHLVVVARGAKARCAQHQNGRGSLAIHGTSVAPPAEVQPFHLYLAEFGQFIHVFDEVSLPLVLGELDTATDFLDYLEKKRDAFESGQIIGSFGEEETLALFLVSVLHWKRHDGVRAFPELTGQPIVVGPGAWDDLRGRSEYLDKKRADKVSYPLGFNDQPIRRRRSPECGAESVGLAAYTPRVDWASPGI